MSLWSDMSGYVGSITSSAGSIIGAFTDPTPPEDTSVILLDGAQIPGVVQDEDVQQSLDIERVPVMGRSGTGKIIHGWTDGICRYSLRLCKDDEPDGIVDGLGKFFSGDIAGGFESFTGEPGETLTAIQRLEIINAFAKTYDKDINPKVWKITQELANAHSIHQVIFSRLASRRTSRSDVIDVDIEFLEFIPATVLIETGKAKPPDPPDTPDPDTTDPTEE